MSEKEIKKCAKCKEEFSKLGSITECPTCGGELDKGYIGASGGVTWDAEKSKRIFVYMWSAALILPFWTQNTPALRCKNCKLVLFNHEKIKPKETPASFLKKCVKCGNEIPVGSDYCPLCEAKQKEGV